MPRRRPQSKPAMPRRRGPPRPQPSLPPGDHDRRLAEEVIYLHSLWHRGPPAPARAPASASAPTLSRSARAPASASAPTLSGSACGVANKPKRRRLDSAAAAAEPQDTKSKWAVAPSPPKSSPETWPEAAPVSSSPATAKPPPSPPPSPGALAEQQALRAAAEFFSNRGPSDDEEDDDESESEGQQDAAGFITGLFVRDTALRGHYERTWEDGQFACLACAGGTRKVGRRFRGCAALVHHARAATRYGRTRAHRALAAVVCRVLGWDVGRLPSIVTDPRGTLGQELASGATVDLQLPKDNDYTGEEEEVEEEEEEDDDEDEDEDEEEEEEEEEEEVEDEDEENEDEVEDEEEDVETWVEDSSTDGDEENNELETSEESAEKKDVEEGMEDSKNIDDDEEAIELHNGEKSSEKEEVEEIGPSNCKALSENKVLHSESAQEVNASKDDSLNQGNNGDVHMQEIAKESSEQENTNNTYLPGSKDTCENKEHCKEAAVQEEEDGGENKKEQGESTS